MGDLANRQTITQGAQRGEALSVEFRTIELDAEER